MLQCAAPEGQVFEAGLWLTPSVVCELVCDYRKNAHETCVYTAAHSSVRMLIVSPAILSIFVGLLKREGARTDMNAAFMGVC
jgi:hypothetical protein